MARGPGDLRVDVRPPGPGPLQLLEDQHGATFTDDEAVALDVEGHGDAAARQGRHVGEAGDPGVGHAGLGGTGDDHIAAAGSDEAGAVGHAVGSGGAGGDGRFARPPKAVPHGHVRRGPVAHHHRHQERADAPGTPVAEHADLRFQGFQATHARSDDDTRPVGIEGEAAAVQTAGVGQGLGCRYRRELGEAVNPPEILGPVEISGIEVRADPAGARRLGAEQAIPKRVPADAAGRHHADTRDGDPATLNALTAVGRGVNRQHQSFEDTSSKA